MCNEQEIELMKERIKEVDIVSFDIFDTLFLRNVLHPTDIYDIVEKKYYIENKKKVQFKKKRIQAEQVAREKSKNEEITYDEIYEVLAQSMPNDYKELKDLEVEIESELIICNTRMLEVYNFALRQNKEVMIISDMYLDKSVIQKILNEKGYVGKHEIYISSNTMKTKATGSIYKYLRDSKKIDKNKKWLHIGDNYIADVKNAEVNHVIGYHYKPIRDRYHLLKCENIADSVINAVKINNLYLLDTTDYWDTFIIDKVFPIYIGFLKWLTEELRGKDNIYFLSRDGYIPYHLYKKIQKTNKDLPYARYLYASRRAYLYPQMKSGNQEEAIEVLLAHNEDLNQYITISEVCANIGLDVKDYDAQLKECSILDSDELLKTEEAYKRAKDFLRLIWIDIEEKLEKERTLLQQYFKQEGLDEFEEVNIVDIGWRGSTQKSLLGLLGKNVNGYYIGTLHEVYEEIKDKSKGYLFDKGTPKKNKWKIMNNVMLYEFIFSAPEGTLMNFYLENGRILPNLNKVEDDVVYLKNNRIKEVLLDIFNNDCINLMKYIDVPTQKYKYIEDLVDRCTIQDLRSFKHINASVGMGLTRDVKQFVEIYTVEQYNDNMREIKENRCNRIWENGVLVVDNYQREFTEKEYDKLSDNRSIGNQHIIYSNRRLKMLLNNPRKYLVKFIKRPGYYTKKIIYKILKEGI